MTRGRWPLHPKPRDWEGLETWVRRIAAAYGVSYDTFLRHALGRTGQGARDLDHAPDATLEDLAAGTGVSLERLRGMRSAALLARMVESVAAWVETEEGRTACAPLWEGMLCWSCRAMPDDSGARIVPQPDPAGFTEHRLRDRLSDNLRRY